VAAAPSPCGTHAHLGARAAGRPRDSEWRKSATVAALEEWRHAAAGRQGASSRTFLYLNGVHALHNGDAINNGAHVHGLAGQRVEWEPLAVASEQGGERYVYFKYHKPLNVASTWDKNDRSSMLHFMPPDLLTRKGGGEGQPIPGRIPTNDFMLQRRQQQMGEYRGVCV
jgi:hypothetical protein